MAYGQRVRIEVVEILGSGTCPVGFEVGDAWMIESGIVPEGMCGSAYVAIAPFLQVLRFGGRLPWAEEGEARVCCPDPSNPVVFRLTVLADE